MAWKPSVGDLDFWPTIDEAAASQIRLVAGYMMAVDVSTGMSVGSRVCSLPNKYQTDVDVGKQRATGFDPSPHPRFWPHPTGGVLF